MIRKALLLGMGAGLAYFGYRFYQDVMADAAGKKLSSDKWGNYDIDGVSYDHENNDVVVSGDKTHGLAPAPQLH